MLQLRVSGKGQVNHLGEPGQTPNRKTKALGPLLLLSRRCHGEILRQSLSGERILPKIEHLAQSLQARLSREEFSKFGLQRVAFARSTVCVLSQEAKEHDKHAATRRSLK